MKIMTIVMQSGVIETMGKKHVKKTGDFLDSTLELSQSSLDPLPPCTFIYNTIVRVQG